MMRQIFYKVIICSCMLMACFVSKAQNAYYFHFHDKGIQVFYTDMVDSMTVSKVDLDGIEHDDFVTQQVWMNDTVFNYALADIDSVSFVTPSTIYQPGVVKLEDGLENYVVSHDSLTIILGQTLQVAYCREKRINWFTCGKRICSLQALRVRLSKL